MLMIEDKKDDNLKVFLPRNFKRDRQTDIDFWKRIANSKPNYSVNLPYFVQNFREKVLKVNAY